MNENTNQILNARQLKQKIKRIAYEIYEQNFSEKEIVFAGIVDRGYVFAELLLQEFSSISDIPARLAKINLDKTSPLQSEITLDLPIEDFRNKVIIITDDVLNSGRTLAYSLKPFLNIEISRLQTAVVVDRGYKDFPISADYVGYSLSTTLQEHIQVVFGEGEESGVFLL